MEWWNVLDWQDQKTVRLVGALDFVPALAIGPAVMVDPTNPSQPVPEPALSTQVVNGVTQVVVNNSVLNTLLPGLKL